MSTNIDVYKIPTKYKNLDYYADEHLEYENENEDYENLIFTIGGFDCANVITGLFDITYSKVVPLSGNALFEGKYIITLEEFSKAKTTYIRDYNKKFLMEEYGIKNDNFDYIDEALLTFFKITEPIIKIEKKMFFRIG